MTALSNVAAHYWDPALPAAILVIQEIQATVGDDFEAVLSPLRVMLALENMAPSIGQAHFPTRHVLRLRVTSLLWLMAELIQKERKHWRLWLPIINLTYGLYTARVFDAVGIQGKLERNPERAKDFAQYLKPVNHMARHICLSYSSGAFFAARDEVREFLTRQLYQIFTHRLVSGQQAGAFYRQLRCSDSASYLALLYEELTAAAPQKVMNIESISLLDIAEQISLPFEGMQAQSVYAARLLNTGMVTQVSVDNLSPQQLHALRHASRIWPELRDCCFYCRVRHQRRQDLRLCSACKRSTYCGHGCQKRDWKGGHKRICAVFRMIDARVEIPNVKALILKLPRGIRSGYLERQV